MQNFKEIGSELTEKLTKACAPDNSVLAYNNRVCIRFSVHQIIQLVRFVTNYVISIIICHLKLEIALAIPASNDE